MDSFVIERVAETQRLEELLRYSGRQVRPKLILVTGPPGIGKTTFVNSFAENRMYPYEIYSDTASNLMNLENSIAKNLNELPRPGSLVDFSYFIDDAELLNRSSFERAYSQISNYKYCIAVVLAGRDQSDFLRNVPVSRTETIRLGEFTDQEAHNYIVKQLGHMQIPAHDVDYLVSFSRKIPFLLSQLIQAYRHHGLLGVEKNIRGEIYNYKENIELPEQEIIQLIKPKIILEQNSIVSRIKSESGTLYDLSPRQFEEVLAELLIGMGYDITLTSQSNDGGKDIIARVPSEFGEFICLVEAKKFKKTRKVGVELIRTLYGTIFDHEGASKGMLVTTSSFTRGAKDFQKRHNYQLSLKDYKNVMSWIENHKI